MQPSEYKHLKALSQSALKQIEYDPKSFFTYTERWLRGETQLKEFPPTESMLLGELVDCLVTSPQEFASRFTVHTADQPTGQMGAFVKEYIRLEKEASQNYTIELSKESVQQLAQDAYSYAEFKRDSLAKVLERFKTEGLAYYNVFRNAGDKTIVSKDMHQHAMSLVTSLQTDNFGKKYFGTLPSHMEPLDQFIVTVEDHAVHNYPLKGLIDRVLIDHNSKKIYLVDLKTTHEDFFPSSIITYRYDLQAALYSYLIWRYMAASKLPMYDVQPFIFVTVNTTNNKVVVWQLSDNDKDVGRKGGQTHYGRKVKGFEQLLQDYHWHKINDMWDYPREVYENQGSRVTNCFTPNA